MERVAPQMVIPLNNHNVTPVLLAADAALAMLDRHQQRRRQRVPTLSVLAGRHETAEQLVRRWAEHEQRTVCTPLTFEPCEALSSWFDALLESHPITAAAWARLAERDGRDAQPLACGLPARSLEERTLFLDRLLGATNAASADAVCRAIIEHACLWGTATDSLWHRLQDACAGDASRAATGILDLLGAERTPLLFATAATLNHVAPRTIFAKAASLATALPALPIVLSAGAEHVAEYLATTPECHALALAREGLVWIAEQAAPAPAKQTTGVGPIAPQPDDARSAAERYLFERLQAHPTTAGLFELNGMLDLTGGGRALEVDLLARRARVAVEIDGYYHFTDWEAYRRDREKDVALQLAGYVVVRCLADDVAGRLENILETIITVVKRTPS